VLTAFAPSIERDGPALVAASVAVVRAQAALVPEVAIILGTGLGGLASAMQVECAIPYETIPGFATPTVESHSGRLLFGTLGGRRVVAMQGRFHRYEGYSLAQVTLPVRVMQALGAQTLVVSNACGGIRADWSAGDLMVISDHINLLGDNPLIGPHEPEWGDRFPDMSAAYDAQLRTLAHDVARAQGTTLREGVYAAVMGPNLETRAEYAMLRTMGADVVGMSTVPEVIVARQAKMRVLGLSIITDECVPETLEEASLEKILAVAAIAEPKLTALVRGVMERL
jgi:purine-nucleoside phosphorylase